MSRGEGSAVKIPSYQFRRLLEDTPLTDREVADALEVSRATVRRWRIGDSDPTVAACRQLAKLHETTWRELNKRVKLIRRDVGHYKTVAGLDNGAGDE